jgi:hypothetical protein
MNPYTKLSSASGPRAASGSFHTAIHAAPGKFDPPAQVHARLKERIDAAVKALKEAGR